MSPRAVFIATHGMAMGVLMALAVFPAQPALVERVWYAALVVLMAWSAISSDFGRSVS